MDIKSHIKSATIQELMEMQELISKEMKSRRTKPQKIKKVITYTDGASRGNPGHAGIGVIIFDEHDEKILQDYQYIGQTTNNEAEYRALLLALDRASELTQGEVDCYMDSELVARQLNGQYAIKSEKLIKFYEEIRSRIGRFERVRFSHVPREHPKQRLADQLANKAIDEMKLGRA